MAALGKTHADVSSTGTLPADTFRMLLDRMAVGCADPNRLVSLAGGPLGRDTLIEIAAVAMACAAEAD